VALILRPRGVSPTTGWASSLAKLQQWGIISHWEPLFLGPDRHYRLYLRYTKRCPGVSVTTFVRRSQLTHTLSVATLACLARERAGVRLVLQTSRGLLTLEECLKWHLGGMLVFSLIVG
jgi:ribosomal protein S8